jgi:hypothetical protein
MSVLNLLLLSLLLSLFIVLVTAAIEKSVVEPLHSADDPATAESVAEPLQSVVDSDAATDAPTKTFYS